MPGKAFLISILFSFLLHPTPIFSKILHLTGIRPPFFLLKADDSGDGVAEPHVIYRANGTLAGEYDLLESTGTVWLCRCRDLSLDIGFGCYVNINPAPAPRKKAPVKKKPRENEGIRLRGIRFSRVDGGIYVTLNPVPLSIVRPVSMAGVEGFVSRIGKAYTGEFRVSLLSPEEIVKFLDGGRKRTCLALREGSPVLVFVGPQDNRENRVSDKIMMRLKYEMFIPLKAEVR